MTAAELVAFAAREDLPSETLLDWVRKERRATVLAQIAAKQDLPVAVFEALAVHTGASVRHALLSNETAPVHIRADIIAAMHDMVTPDRTRWLCSDTLTGSGSLQREVFDRLKLNGLGDCLRVSGWAGLATRQLHSLLGVVEQLFAARLAALEVGNPVATRPGQAIGTADAVYRLARHPAADEALLERIETFVDSSDRILLKHQKLPAAIAETRNRLSAFGGVPAGVVSASYAQLVDLAEFGALGTWAVVMFSSDQSVVRYGDRCENTDRRDGTSIGRSASSARLGTGPGVRCAYAAQ